MYDIFEIFFYAYHLFLKKLSLQLYCKLDCHA